MSGWAKLLAVEAAIIALLIAAGPLAAFAPASSLVARTPRAAELVLIAGGKVQIGDDASQADERPQFTYSSRPLYYDRTPVTVAQFAAFVADTGYRTEAERFGEAGVFDSATGEWRLTPGATWRRPQGPDHPQAKGDHPVTQVSWNDADVFCRAYGARLPTEFEWERAGRLGQTANGHVFTAVEPPLWSNPVVINVWQGPFPVHDAGDDGYRFTSPVAAYGYAPSGLADMAGNVWEWTASWYGAYAGKGRIKPHVPAERVQRGGSFLCDGHSCRGFRVTARSGVSPETALMHAGFRCVVDPDKLKVKAGRVAEPPTPGNQVAISN